jgi:hypothetical protein
VIHVLGRVVRDLCPTLYCGMYLKKWEYNGAVHQLYIDLRKAYDSVRREVLCNVLIEFGIP